jgi:CHAT domain-containing protein/Tfp pilus assembly protein PilF
MRTRNHGRRLIALSLAALVLSAQAAHAAAQGGAGQTFTAGDLSFSLPPGWAASEEGGDENSQTFVVKRAGVDAEIRLIVARQSILGSGVKPEELLDAARRGIIAPRVDQLAAVAANAGQRAVRSAARADFGGAAVDGERILFSVNNVPLAAEFYALLVGGRLAVVSYIAAGEGVPQQSAPAWDALRRTLAVGGVPLAKATPPPPDPAGAALDQAMPLLEESLKVAERVVKLRGEGKYAEAIPLAERNLALAERIDALGLPTPDGTGMTPGALNVLGELHRAAGRYEQAEPLLRRSVELTERAKGAGDFSLAAPLNNLAGLYLETGDHARAEPLFLRAVQIAEKTRGADDPFTATAVNNLAQFYDTTNDFARAEELMRRSLAIREKALGPDHPDVAVSLSNLGALYDQLGDPVRAEQMTRRALDIMEKRRGPDHPETATVLNNLGFIFRNSGDFQRSEQYYVRALAVNERALGPEHPTLASTVDNLAQLFFARGEYARAESLYKRGMAIREKAFGAENTEVAESLSNLALLYQEQGDLARAEPLLVRARDIFERRLGAEHAQVATALDNLGTLYHAQRRSDQAEPLMARALAIREKLFGPESTEAAVSYNNLGGLALRRGDAARAETLYLRALRIYERIYGGEHPTVALLLNNLSTGYVARDDAARAVSSQARAMDVSERQLAHVLATGSEEQKRLYAARLREELDYTLWLHAGAAPSDAAALKLALTTVLRRKGRVLDAMSDQIGALRRHLRPEDRALLDRLSARRAELAALALKGPGKTPAAEFQSRLTQLGGEIERLEGEIGARSLEYRAQSQPVTLEAVQRALPAGTTLVEFAVYRPYNRKSRSREENFGAPRYAAYVLPRAGAAQWVELGEAAAIDGAVAAWRAALADSRRTDVRQLARDVDERVMRPVRKLLGNEARQLFLSPDGALNLIPFGALADEQNRYLVESYSLTYLTSGRDLLRLQVKVDAAQPPVVVADPAFDAGGPQQRGAARASADAAAQQRGAAAAAGRRSADLAGTHFARLPGTAGEARAIGSILPGVRVLTAGQATEATLKQLSRPEVLHVATHGFFLIDQKKGAGGASRPAAARGENPLLRSGLALAGANALAGGAGEDGILTAYEAAGLDLWGTRLAVLSACETGVGEVESGDGVYGLRRALVLAGTESQVMSLWQVSDEATRDLMIEYYRRLQAGEGRTDALRRVQLEMLTGRKQESGAGGAQRGLAGAVGGQPQAGDRSHPFYWAAFIQSGDWRPMRQVRGDQGGRPAR